MNSERDLATLRAAEGLLGGTQHADGKDFMDAVDNLTTAQATSRTFVAPTDSSTGVARFSFGNHSSESAASDNATLILSTDCDGHLEADISGDNRNASVRPGTLTFVPHGLTQAYDFRGSTTNTVVSLNKRVFEQVVEANCGFSSMGVLEPRLQWTRPAIQKLIEEQFATMASGEAGWKLLAEANAIRLAVEIFRAFGHERKTAKTHAALSQAEISRIAEFVDAELGCDFDLSALAHVIDRDVFAFTRAFKAATGETPHQFVIQRRLMCAKQMLANSAAPIAEIAYDCGFSSQSHMTSTFTKHLSVSPGVYRRQVRG